MVNVKYAAIVAALPFAFATIFSLIYSPWLTLGYVIAPLILIAADMFSGTPGGYRWQFITALFAWSSGISLVVVGILFSITIISIFFGKDWSFLIEFSESYILPFTYFTLFTALFREVRVLLSEHPEGVKKITDWWKK